MNRFRARTKNDIIYFKSENYTETHVMKNTTLSYIERDGKYLMLHRTKKVEDENMDKWIGIGGKFEDKESPEDCVLREVKEETGLTLTSFKYRGIVTFVSDIWPTEYMHLFTADGFTGDISDCDEGDLEWIPKNELLRLTLWEGDKIFLRLLDSGAPFFSLKLEYRGSKLVSAALDGAEIDGKGASK
jgi:8-oxo-dGTP diphosphatase